MDNKAIRLHNLKLLVKRVGGIDALAERCGMASGKYFEQILNGFQGKRDRTPRGLGNLKARELEQVIGAPNGWMDQPHYQEWAECGIEVLPAEDINPPCLSNLAYLSQPQDNASRKNTSATVVNHHVPICTWTSCKMARSDYDNLQYESTYPLHDPIPGRLIALTVEDASMQAQHGDSFPPGTTLIFDIDMTPSSGDFVLVEGPDGNAYFRKYVVDVGRKRLHPLNALYEPTSAPTERKAYLGVLVLAVPPAVYRRR